MWAWVVRAMLIAGALAQTAVLVVLALLAMPEPPPTTVPLAPGPLGKVERSVGGFPHFFGSGQQGACTRILAIDGGGVRGIIPALVLAEIERRTGKSIANEFNIVVGTSTGAILALGLTRPSEADAEKPAFAAADIVALYRDHAGEIFPTSFQWLRNLQRVFRPKYFAQGPDGLFASYFGDVRLHEALTYVAVPAYDIEDRRRLWFDSFDSVGAVLTMKDVVRGATAAPTYLPPSKFAVDQTVSPKGYFALVDGALFANNPAPEALDMARKLVPADGDQSLLLLSIGTGASNQRRSFESAWNWGILGWVDPLLEITISDPSIEKSMERTLADQDYMRLQLDLGPDPVAIDDASAAALQRLTAMAEDFIRAHDDDLQTLSAALAKPRAKGCLHVGSPWEPLTGPRKHEAAAQGG